MIGITANLREPSALAAVFGGERIELLVTQPMLLFLLAVDVEIGLVAALGVAWKTRIN